jgi:Protein of unknown function (DUF3828)
MKRIILTLAFSLMSGIAFAAQPMDVVTPFYADPGSELGAENVDKYTGKANEVMKLSNEPTEEGACIDFMMSVDAQDFDEDVLKKSLNITEALAGDQATVVATFKLFKEDTEDKEIDWEMEKVDGAWKIADIYPKDKSWQLTKMECGPVQ